MKENEFESTTANSDNTVQIDNKDKKAYTRPDLKSKKSPRKKLLWTFLLIAIIGVTIWSITSQEDFSFEGFKASLLSANPWWLLAAVASMIMFIVIEAYIIKIMIKAFKYKQPFGNCLAYSSTDIYFSAITPSATGGQPACAYLMMKDGLPGSFSAVALLIYLVAYNFSIIAMGLITFLINPSLVAGFATTSKVLIIVGAFCLAFLATFVLIALFKGKILLKCGNFFVSLLAKMHIIKKPQKWKNKVASSIASYTDCVTHLKGKRNMVIKVFFLAAAQRASSLLVTVFVCLAIGGNNVSPFNAWYAQCMVILGTNMLPVPGGSLFFETLLSDAFASYGLTNTMASSLTLLSRGISFYLCIVLSGVTMIIKAVYSKVKAKKANQLEAIAAQSELVSENEQSQENNT